MSKLRSKSCRFIDIKSTFNLYPSIFSLTSLYISSISIFYLKDVLTIIPIFILLASYASYYNLM